MQDARDAIVSGFDQLADNYDTGSLSGLPDSVIGYLAALVLRDHVVLHGNAKRQPLGPSGALASVLSQAVALGDWACIASLLNEDVVAYQKGSAVAAGRHAVMDVLMTLRAQGVPVAPLSRRDDQGRITELDL
jgi:hypothetical protein